MSASDKESKGIKQPENLVYYKPTKELYSTLHMCIYMRELPEITPEEIKQMEEKEKIK